MRRKFVQSAAKVKDAFPFAAGSHGTAGNRRKRRDRRDLLLFIGPVFAIYTFFFIVPLVQGILYSFTDWGGIGANFSFVGLDNYRDLFTKDAFFVDSLGFTFGFAFWNVLLTNILAMCFAVALTNKFRLNNLFRTIIFIPNVISMVISGFIWLFMFSKISKVAYDATGFGLFDISWLGDERYVLLSIVIVSLWQGIGYIMTIYIAGLQGVDDSLLEAASIDGASPWQTFWRIKLPIMLPTITVGAFINIAGSLKIFDIVMSLTAGGPGRASEVAMINIYREAFVNNNMGYGSAKATVLSILIILIAVAQFRYSARREV